MKPQAPLSRILLMFVLLFALGTMTLTAQNYYYNKGNLYAKNRYMHDDAFQEWVKGMKAGEPNSALMVILCYLNEFGTPRNVAKATQIMDQWYKKDDGICKLAAYFWGAKESGAFNYVRHKWIFVDGDNIYYHYAERYNLKPNFEKVFKYASYSVKHFPKSVMTEMNHIDKILLSYCYWKGLGGAPVDLAKAVAYTNSYDSIWGLYSEPSDVFKRGDGNKYISDDDEIIGPWGIAISMIDKVKSIEEMDKCLAKICEIGVYDGDLYSFKHFIDDFYSLDMYYCIKNNAEYFVKRYRSKMQELKSELITETNTFTNTYSSKDWDEWYYAYCKLPYSIKNDFHISDPIIEAFINNKINGNTNNSNPDWRGYEKIEKGLPKSIKDVCISSWIKRFKNKDDNYSTYYNEAPESFKSYLANYYADYLKGLSRIGSLRNLSTAEEAYVLSFDPNVRAKAMELWTKYKIEKFTDSDVDNYESILSDPRFDKDYLEQLYAKYEDCIQRRQEERNKEEAKSIVKFWNSVVVPSSDDLRQMNLYDYNKSQLLSFYTKISTFINKLGAFNDKYPYTQEGPVAKRLKNDSQILIDFVSILKKEDEGTVSSVDYESFKELYSAKGIHTSELNIYQDLIPYLDDGYALARLGELNCTSSKQAIKEVKSLPMSKLVAKKVKEGTKRSVLSKKQ